MLCRSSFWAIGPLFLLAGVVLAGEPIFDSQPGHPWDQAREIFYTHRFPTGEIYEHPHAFAPPWKEFVPFVHDAAFHEQVLARLEAVVRLQPAQMDEQPSSRRLIFFGDLWPVFDELQGAQVEVPGDKVATAKAVGRRDELLRRVAGLMKRLELAEEEVRALPNAFQLVGDPVDTSSFESIILPDRMALAPSKTEPPSESLIALKYKTLREIPSSLESCIHCHSYRNQLFGSSGPVKAAFLQSDPDKAADTIVKKKEASEEWKLYLRMGAGQAK